MKAMQEMKSPEFGQENIPPRPLAPSLNTPLYSNGKIKEQEMGMQQ